jgi:hypothetical protein
LRAHTHLSGAILPVVLALLPAACAGGTRLEPVDDESGGVGAGAVAGLSGTSSGAGAGGRGSGGSTGAVSGTGAAAGTNGAAGTIGMPPTNAFPCLDPEPIDAAGSGYDRCRSGYIRRSHAANCSSELPRPDPVPDYDPATDSCQYDSDCDERPHGACESVLYAPNTNRYCRYGCVVDSECENGSICLCGDPVGVCVPASCSSGADCLPGFECSSYDPGCPLVAFACQSPADRCGGNADCEPSAGGPLFCAIADAVRMCSPPSCAP